MTSAQERGRLLEQRIGDFFHGNGYEVELNVILEGRSGGRHEVDVLAKKSDTLTTFKVAIECKAWAQPIEKDVVSKLHHVLSDLGLSKGIVVSLAGCRSGAQQAAEALGIELWGQDELRRHLGDVGFEQTVAGVAEASLTKAGPGFPFRIPEERAEALIRSSGKSRFKIRTLEALTRMDMVYLPVFHVTFTISQPLEKRFKTHLRSTTIDNVYEALTGSYVEDVEDDPTEIELEGCVLPPLRRDAQVQAALRNAVDARLKVTSESACDRHDANLYALGVPTPCQSLTVEVCQLAYHPYYVGILESGWDQRAVAISGMTGDVSHVVGTVLTANLPHLKTCLASERRASAPEIP